MVCMKDDISKHTVTYSKVLTLAFSWSIVWLGHSFVIPNPTADSLPYTSLSHVPVTVYRAPTIAFYNHLHRSRVLLEKLAATQLFNKFSELYPLMVQSPHLMHPRVLHLQSFRLPSVLKTNLNTFFHHLCACYMSHPLHSPCYCDPNLFIE